MGNNPNWKAPVHYFSVIVVVALDIIWGVMEGVVMFMSPLFVLMLSAVVGFVGGMAVYYVQRNMAHDSEPHAVAKGLVMGIIAVVPFMFTSTVLGLAVMMWLAAASIMKGDGSDDGGGGGKRTHTPDDLPDSPQRKIEEEEDRSKNSRWN